MPSTDRRALLEQGLAQHRAGRLAEALLAYRRVLDADPGDPDALNLAADAAFGLKRYDEAADLFAALAAAQPGDARVRFNGGIAARLAGRPDAAVAAFRAAVDLDPAYPGGWFNLGVACREAGRPAEAVAAYEEAVAADPDDAAAIANLAAVLSAARAFNPAFAVFETAIARRPDDPQIRLMQAEAFRGLDLNDSAVAACREAVRLAPREARGHAALGLSLARAGRHDEAVDACRRALALDAGQPAVHAGLSASLLETGDAAAALAAAEAALALDPGLGAALRARGRALVALSRADEALASYRAAVEAAPGDIDALAGLAAALAAAGRDHDEIVAAYRAAIDRNPPSPRPYTNLAALHLERGEAEAALAVTGAALSRFPGDTAALALRAVAAGPAGDPATARILNDYVGLMMRRDVTPPAGWESLAAFNAALADHVRNHPSIEFAPADHATRHGYHTGELRIEPKGPIAGLEEVIAAAVARYRETHPVDPAHPFLAHAPDQVGLNIWSVILRESGHQVPHIHSAAWLSGVYYPLVPPVIGSDSRAGWIEFGRPPDAYAGAGAGGSAPPVIEIRPVEGLMILFPAYMYHRTIPFAGDGTRISIAFDVCPAT